MEKYKIYLEEGTLPHLQDYQHESKFQILTRVFLTLKNLKLCEV